MDLLCFKILLQKFLVFRFQPQCKLKIYRNATTLQCLSMFPYGQSYLAPKLHHSFKKRILPPLFFYSKTNAYQYLISNLSNIYVWHNITRPYLVLAYKNSKTMQYDVLEFLDLQSLQMQSNTQILFFKDL